MEALPAFALITPATLADVLAARRAHPGAQLLGGGTDLLVNVRRGIVAPSVLIDLNGADADRKARAFALALFCVELTVNEYDARERDLDTHLVEPFARTSQIS